MPGRSRIPQPWTAAERRVLKRLKSPQDIQLYLNALKYDADYRARSPRRSRSRPGR